MEDGTVVLVGATMKILFELNARCCRGRACWCFIRSSRTRSRSCSSMPKKIEGKKLPLDQEATRGAGAHGDGDGRAALTLAEKSGVPRAKARPSMHEQLQDILQRRAPIYDKSADGHYNLISALHKSVRGSDPDAALYYLARMMDAGEDPVVSWRGAWSAWRSRHWSGRSAGAVICNAAKDAYDFLGHPEGELRSRSRDCICHRAGNRTPPTSAFGAAMRAAKEGRVALPPNSIF